MTTYFMNWLGGPINAQFVVLVIMAVVIVHLLVDRRNGLVKLARRNEDGNIFINMKDGSRWIFAGEADVYRHDHKMHIVFLRSFYSHNLKGVRACEYEPLPGIQEGDVLTVSQGRLLTEEALKVTRLVEIKFTS